MSDQKKEEKKQTITAYEASLQIQPQSQELPGAEHKMDPQPECSKLEHWDKDGRPYLKEYVGSAKLEGKKAIITGGDSGIGKAVAIFFAREGADLSLVYLPDEQKDAENTQAEISKTTGRKVNLIPVDLRDKSSYQTIVKSHNQAFGNQIDILVNNASQQILKKDIKDVMDKDIEETFQANIIQMIGLTREIVPHLKRGASIVNTTSVTAYQGSPQFIDYSSTKGAIVSFTRALAGQLAPKGIRVNGVAPGPVYTPLQPASRTPENMEDWGIGDVPLHGRAAQPAEMAEAYVLLAGPGGNYITGTIIHANGGKHIGGA